MPNKELNLVIHEDGSANLVNHPYTEQGFEVLFEKIIVDYLKDKKLNDYDFNMNVINKEWEITEQKSVAGGVADITNFLRGTLTKESNKITCIYRKSILGK